MLEKLLVIWMKNKLVCEYMTEWRNLEERKDRITFWVDDQRAKGLSNWLNRLTAEQAKDVDKDFGC